MATSGVNRVQLVVSIPGWFFRVGAYMQKSPTSRHILFSVTFEILLLWFALTLLCRYGISLKTLYCHHVRFCTWFYGSGKNNSSYEGAKLAPASSAKNWVRGTSYQVLSSSQQPTKKCYKLICRNKLSFCVKVIANKCIISCKELLLNYLSLEEQSTDKVMASPNPDQSDLRLFQNNSNL